MLLALSEAGQRAATLGGGAAVALGVWLVLLAVLALATRPNLPDAMPPSSDFPGDESPAVVSFLVDRWDVGHEAIPATLLDLAARKVVAIDQVSPERFVCRLRRREHQPDLTDYEKQVLDHVRTLASPDGVVPCEALTTGPEEESKGWWERFEKAVVADARSKGLSRSRWGRPALMALGVAAVAPAVLAAAAFVAAPTEESSSSSEDDNPVVAFLGLSFLGWSALMTIPYKLRAERDTPAGRAAASRWLGLRDYLAENEAFGEAPPAAVAIWDRYLSYGAAMGVAAGAVRALPLGAESDREAWSAYGGQWHVVKIRYPVRFPPGYGSHPLAAAGKGLLIAGFFGMVVRTIGPPLLEAIRDFAPTSGWARLAEAGFGVMLGILGFVVLRGLALLVGGLVDLFARQEVEGLVVRLKGTYLAVDDGQRREVRAWRVQPLKLGGAVRGSVVRVHATRWLGYVSGVELVDRERSGAVL
jgi:hypothetical protein